MKTSLMRTLVADAGREGLGSEFPSLGLRTRVLRGGLVRVGTQAAVFLLRLASLMVLARLLAPADFGLVNMVTAVTGVLFLFKDAGLSLVTVQRVVITHEQLFTLFWVNVAVGASLMVAVVVASPAIAEFYREPRLVWVCVALGAGFLFNGVGDSTARCCEGRCASRRWRSWISSPRSRASRPSWFWRCLASGTGRWW